MKLRRSKADHWFSLYIRERAKWACESCGKQYPMPVLADTQVKGASAGLHCSHIFGRRNRSTRWDERNAVAQCFTCHQYYGENPIEFYDWVSTKKGQALIDEVRVKSKQVSKVKEEGIVDFYKSEFMRLYSAR